MQVNTRSVELRVDGKAIGMIMLMMGFLIGVGALVCFILAVKSLETRGANFEGIALLIFSLIAFVAAILTWVGLTVVEPNMSRVLLLFGTYKGTIRRAGFFWVNPFTIRRKVSLRVRNFNSETIKVNDKLGNPIEIASVVVWRVNDTAQASFDVEDFEDFVRVQTESAIRHLAAGHPYDLPGEEETSLRGSSETVNGELREELIKRLDLGGIEVLEVRLSHLAYAPEIASAMLQRQQAEAVIVARKLIVDGAVGMVKMALDRLRETGVVDLDEEKKASMVSNLLVVLCSERGTQPVLNAGTLYS